MNYMCWTILQMNPDQAEQIILEVIASGSSEYYFDPEIDGFINTEEDARGNEGRNAERNEEGNEDVRNEGSGEEDARASNSSSQKRRRGERGAVKRIKGRHVITKVSPVRESTCVWIVQ